MDHEWSQLPIKDQALERLEQERDEYKLAFHKLLEQRFRQRSEPCLSTPASIGMTLAPHIHAPARAPETESATLPKGHFSTGF